MPIFRFHCNRCQADFELLLSRSDAAGKCPECGSDDLTRALNRVAVRSGGSTSGTSSGSCGGCSGGCCGRCGSHR